MTPSTDHTQQQGVQQASPPASPPAAINDDERRKEIGELYKLTMEGRNFEIEQLMQRNNFFMVFQGVLLAGFLQAQTKAPPLVTLAACFIGICCSWQQRNMAAGAKFWQSRWEYAASSAEREFLDLIQKKGDVAYHLLSSGTRFSEMVVKEELILTAVERRGGTFGQPKGQKFWEQPRAILPTQKKPLFEPAWLKNCDNDAAEYTEFIEKFRKLKASETITVEDAREALRFQEDEARNKFINANRWLLKREDKFIAKRPSVSRIPIKLGTIFLVGWCAITLQVLWGSFIEPRLSAPALATNWLHPVHLVLDGLDTPASPPPTVQLQNTNPALPSRSETQPQAARVRTASDAAQ